MGTDTNHDAGSEPCTTHINNSRRKGATPPLLLMGATGVGKSGLAFRVAQNCGAEILNADSLQVYKGLDVGTSKPGLEQMQRVKHHLYSVVEVGDTFTVGQYYRRARVVLQNSTRPMLVVGGSGFYLQALEKGLPRVSTVPVGVQKQVEAEAKSDLPLLYQELSRRDPVAAQKIHSHDRYRIIRGVALMRSHEKSLTQIQTEFKAVGDTLPCVKVALCCERAWLRQRLEQRLQLMLKNGFIDEVRALLNLVCAGQLAAGWLPLQSVGYKEAVQFLKNEITREQMCERILKRSMLLAKKQTTWLKRTAGVKSFVMPDEHQMAFQYIQQSLTPKG